MPKAWALLTADGTPKITDFGLARHLDADSGETQAGTVMDTSSYMAPEQASGHAHDAGPANHSMASTGAAAATRYLAELRSALTALAAERYRLAHGAWPRDLAALVPVYLKEVPQDPYDGQPLRYRRTTDGVVVYCLGRPRNLPTCSHADRCNPRPLWDNFRGLFRAASPSRKDAFSASTGFSL